ncbi:MAG: hypothetical protein KGL39_55250 [Patescibacteria group bacterium]|nr:hypothetical protein [Patescibacteria group bacterium]
MALDTVQDYITQSRVLLLDQAAPYRYADSELVDALNMAILEARRLRPDILQAYLRTTPPSFSSTAPTVAVPIDPQYRVAALYYVCGHAQLRDDETTQDGRAAVFLNKFTSQLLTIAA